MKLKFSRTRLMVLGSVALLIVAGALYMVNLNQVSEQETLGAQIATAQGSLPRVTTELKSVEPQVAQMESKVAQAKAAFDRIKASFPDVESVAYGEQLLKLAAQHSLRVVKVTTSEPVRDRRDNITFMATGVEIQMQGKTSDILVFVHSLLTNQSFVSTSVNKLDASEMNKETAAISISLVFYSYRGG